MLSLAPMLRVWRFSPPVENYRGEVGPELLRATVGRQRRDQNVEQRRLAGAVRTGKAAAVPCMIGVEKSRTMQWLVSDLAIVTTAATSLACDDRLSSK